MRVANPAFDITPNELVTAIITEKGVARQPLVRNLAKLAGGPKPRRGEDGEPASRPARRGRGSKSGEGALA